MKKMIITCAFVAIASTVFAQATQPTNAAAPNSNTSAQAPTAETIAGRRAKLYEKQLGLTPEQSKGVYEAELNFLKQDQQARANGGPGVGQAEQNQMTKDQHMRNVLTPEQYAKYLKMRNPAPAPAPAKH